VLKAGQDCVWDTSSLKELPQKKSTIYTFPEFFFFFFVVLGFELKAYTLNHSTSPPFFLIDFLEIVSHKLFAQAVFEPIPRRNFMRNHSSHQQSWYS
jgi:hypothetical protein